AIDRVELVHELRRRSRQRRIVARPQHCGRAERGQADRCRRHQEPPEETTGGSVDCDGATGTGTSAELGAGAGTGTGTVVAARRAGGVVTWVGLRTCVEAAANPANAPVNSAAPTAAPRVSLRMRATPASRAAPTPSSLAMHL